MGVTPDKILGKPLFHSHKDTDLSDFTVLNARYIRKSNDQSTTDIGKDQDSSVDGYNEDYISDKRMSNMRLGSNRDMTRHGDLGLNEGVVQINIDGTVQDFVTNFRFREDETGGGELEHKPIGKQWWYAVRSGNSDKVGIDGLPIIQQYKTTIGADQHLVTLDGGTF